MVSKKTVVLGLFLVMALFIVACTPTPDNNPEMDGEQLAGTSTTPYYEFTQEAYDQAIADNKKIFIQFYATWCPSCRAEQKIAQPFFDTLEDPEIIGFRANFKDKDTSEAEEALAREFGVSSQTTKLFIVDKELVQKTPQHFVTQEQFAEHFQTNFG